jgi:hypothetical protein
MMLSQPKKRATPAHGADDSTKSFTAGVKAMGKPKPKADKTEKKLVKALRKDAANSSPKFKDKI